MVTMTRFTIDRRTAQRHGQKALRRWTATASRLRGRTEEFNSDPVLRRVDGDWHRDESDGYDGVDASETERRRHLVRAADPDDTSD